MYDASGARASLICATGAYGIFNLFFLLLLLCASTVATPGRLSRTHRYLFALLQFAVLASCVSVRSPAHRETPAYFREVNAWFLGLIKNCCNDFFLVQNHSNVAIVSCAATDKITPCDPLICRIGKI